VFKSVNGGGNWTAVNTGLTNTDVRALAIDPAAPTTLYAGTYYGGVFKSVNGGGNWTAVNTDLTNTFVRTLAIDPATPTTLYAGTIDGLFKSVNGGGNWSAVNNGLTSTIVYILAIDPATPTTLYVGTYGGVFKSVNGGGNWNAVRTGYVISLAIDPAAPTTLYAGVGGGVFKSVNGGGNWTGANNGLASTYVRTLAIDPATPTTLYAGTIGGVFIFQHGDDTIPQYSVYSDNTTYKNFPGVVDSYTMGAFLLDTTAPNRIVSVGNLPAASPNDTKTLSYISGWSAVSPYLYAISFLPPTYPSPGADWENRPFHFTIDVPGQSIPDFTIPTGAIRQMGPANVSITGGKHPTISWGHVDGATFYRVRFFPILNPSGNPNIGNLLFQTELISDTGPGTYSFTYEGNLFDTNALLAVSVEAYDYDFVHPSSYGFFYNRSRTIVPYPHLNFLPLIVR
jgi:photosystem II stability/assembly factor-like uncharacterized protein